MNLASGAGHPGRSRTRQKLVCCEACWLRSNYMLVQCGNNWIQKIPLTGKLESLELFSFNYFQIGQHVVLLHILIGARSHGCPISGVRFEHFVIGYHVIFTSITGALMAFFAMFRTVFNTYEKRHRRFRSFLIPKFVIDTINPSIKGFISVIRPIILKFIWYYLLSWDLGETGMTDGCTF